MSPTLTEDNKNERKVKEAPMHTSRGIQCSETVSGVNTSMLLRGGWEKDETIEVAARHKTIEEAGVCGDIELGGRAQVLTQPPSPTPKDEA
ncbi:hypothetical protein FXO38_12939 [Capsicum annuum]|nr:hypothetical protein FXO38_12939 [Capsicum annuum]KAF3668527.1 hypothetical protein FXO37_09511 [Capsicum annuum]